MNIRGPFSKVKYEEFNLNSHKQLKDYFLLHGWKPTTWNYKIEGGRKVKSSPKLTEDSFNTIQGDIPKLLAERNVLKHRINLIKNPSDDTKGLINKVRSDGKISAEGIPQATNTGRYRHKTVVNIPNVDAVYGAEIRELFEVRDLNRVMCGTDAKGLETRTEAHYCYKHPGGVEYAAELMEGDIHTKNAELFGVDRSVAKRIKYALTNQRM